MTKCKSCGVLVDEALKYCPLCRRKFDVIADDLVNEWYPPYETSAKNAKSNENIASVVKPTCFAAIVICCVLTLLNAFVFTGGLWCHTLIIPIAYVAFTITHTFCSRVHLGLKIIFQVVAVTGLLLAVDIQSGFARWSLNYAFPFLIIAATFFIGVMMATRRTRFGELLEFVIALILLSLLPVHLYIYQVTDIIWPAVLAEISSVLTIIGLVTFSKKEFLNEIKKRFHF